jgi:hypothetical protein
MPETLIFDGGDLVLASEDDRIVEGRLLPFGVVGKTNVGGFTVDAGILALPDPDVVTLNIEHDREQPVGRAISLEERADGIYASYRIAKGEEGDKALADIKSGRRRSLSMEAKGVVVRAGKAISGRLFGSGLVERPAFEGATVLAAYSDEEGATPVSESESESTSTYTDHYDGTAYTTTTTVKTTSTTVAEDEEPEDPAEGEEDMPQATVPETVTASAVKPVKSDTTKTLESVMARLDRLEGAQPKRGITPEQAFSIMAAAARGERITDEQYGHAFRSADSLFEEARAVYAAQSNVADPIANQDLSPQWVGEFWGRVKPKALLTDLLTPRTLTSRKVQGFQWTNLPSGASWAGNGAEIHSGAVAAAATAEFPAQYFAGGNTVSRENFDFGGGEAFVEWYFAQQALNVQTWLDSLALAAVVDGTIDGGSTIIAGPHLAAKASVPDNIDQGTSVVVDAIAGYYGARNELPDFVLLDSANWTTMLKAPATAVLGYLSAALGVTEGDVAQIPIRPVPTAKLLQGKQATGTNGSGTNRAILALAGAKAAAEVYTLPGSPFQAQTVNVANGLVNLGAYAYGLVKPNAGQIAANLSDGFYGVY